MIKEAKRLSFIKEYYFSAKNREVAAMVADGKPVLHLGIGNPDMSPSEATVHTLQRSAADGKNHGYQPYKGLPAFRSAFSAWYKRTYGVDVDPDSEVLPLIGSKEGINHICQAFLDPGDLALVPNPGYPTYTSAVRLASADPIAYDLDEENGWEIKWDQLKPSLLQKVKVWFVNYPNMPTGGAGSSELLQKIVDLANTYNILVVNDNPYSLVLNSSSPMSILQVEGVQSNLLELNSLSKSHNMAGWRVGVLAGNAALIQSVVKVKSNIDTGMFKPLQEAAIEALNNTDQWHDERNAEYAKRRDFAYQVLDQLKCNYDESQVGMFLWAKIPYEIDSAEELTERLLHEAYIFITPGFVFGEMGRRYIRISLCTGQDQLKEAVERIKRMDL